MENRLFTLADQLKDAKDRKKELEAEVKKLGSEIDWLDEELSDAMAEADCERFSRNGSMFYLNTRLFAFPAPGKKELLYQALKDQGYGEIVTETVNANTLASFVKEQMAENNEILPEWLAEVVTHYEKVSVGIRKG
ncbi:MAG: hypothetical protein K5760_07010 [Clostridium sp.]|nr:hypothetical protein [Clostridium sp.]